MMNLYAINDVDVADLGLIVNEFLNDLIQLPSSKDVFSYTWSDEDWSEYYLDARYWKDKTATLKGSLTGSDRTDFRNKWAALWALLSASGELRIYSHFLDLTFKAFYLSNPVAQMQSFDGDISMKIEIEFQIIGAGIAGEVISSNHLPAPFPIVF